ncbi:hypothetical protein D3C78_1221510 [compost metagenome]
MIKIDFSKIAGMMKQNQYNEIKELYIELSGEVYIPESTNLQVTSKTDLTFGRLSFEAAQIYFDYKSTPPLENRKNIAIAIRKNVALIMQENREKFIKLADHIEDGKKIKLKKSLMN